uniref:Uncharacterized protein n=1 Tax=Leersia perrieri TaxID=77586 RepID=A0A0D9VFA6_9ORYZ
MPKNVYMATSRADTRDWSCQPPCGRKRGERMSRRHVAGEPTTQRPDLYPDRRLLIDPTA